MSTTRSLLTSTLSRQPNPTLASDTSPYLFLVVQSERPSAFPIRVCLRDSRSVRIGRIAESDELRVTELDRGAFEIGVPDRWMSSTHAVIQKVLGVWVIEDARSKNGTVVNGRFTLQTQLADGDLIELGQTFFIFRENLPVPPNEPAILRVNDLRPSGFGLMTLTPSLIEDLVELEAIAPSSVSVSLHGESGTGKEVIASAVHQLSGRRGPFVPVNCGALSKTLVESELFGYRKGAFSGADEDREGLIRTANGGTLFLDEIGDLPASAQTALLRVLQEGEVLPVGATRPVKVDFRLLVATHRDLEALVEQDQFRGDLLARISGFTVVLPPLRERREDLGLLIRALLQRELGERADGITFSNETMRALLLYPWPFNIRELEKSLSVSVVLAKHGLVELAHLPASLRGSQAKAAKKSAAGGKSEQDEHGPLTERERQRRDQILALLRAHTGNITAAAQAMGKPRSQLQRWIKRFQIHSKDFRI